MIEDKWECVSYNTWNRTERLKVEGGYLYNTVVIGMDSSMCFVPDIDLTRYQSHLRDAYTQGYKDGQEDMKNGIVNEEEGLTAYDSNEAILT